jgi:hypothetical protein
MGSTLIFAINLAFFIIYRYGLFAKYKIEKDQPWPWESDREGWRDLVKRATI